MTFDHLVADFSKLTGIFFYTDDILGFVSAAEGFVLLSGFVCAAAYLPLLAQGREKEAQARVVRRLVKIYLAQIILAFLYIFFIAAKLPEADHFPWARLAPAALLKEFALAMALLCQPQYVDILPLYFLFSLVTLPALQLMRRGHENAVIFLSLVLWLASQFLPYGHVHGSIIFPFFNPLAWQFLFIIGLVLGCAHVRSGSWRAVFPESREQLWRIISWCVVILCLGLKFWEHSHVDMMIHEKGPLSPLRLLDTLCAGVVLAGLSDLLPVSRWENWLSLLGRRSLYVFFWSTSLICFGLLLQPRLAGFGLPAQAGIFVLMLMSLAVPAWRTQVKKNVV